MHTSPKLYVGIDIAARSASIAAIERVKDVPHQFNIEQAESGYKQLHKFLHRYESSPSDTQIIMEATGTYWLNIAIFLCRLGYRVSVVNPASAYYFARSVLKRQKNDPMDALTLAEMGVAMWERLPVYHEPPPIYEEIRQRLVQRDALVSTKVQMGNRKHATTARGTVSALTDSRTTLLMNLLTQQIAEIDQELEELFKGDGEWAASARRLMTIPGIATVNAAWILVATQHFETFDTPQQAASFAGLVPRQRQSGTSLNVRAKIGYAGHKRLRHILYLAAMVAIRFNPPVKQFYQRLVKKGKSGKVALIAAARKLLHQCWAIVKYQREFDANYGKAQNGQTGTTEVDTNIS